MKHEADMLWKGIPIAGNREIDRHFRQRRFLVQGHNDGSGPGTEDDPDTTAYLDTFSSKVIPDVEVGRRVLGGVDYSASQAVPGTRDQGIGNSLGGKRSGGRDI